MALLVNKIKCRKCGDIIESTYTHDFKSCSCGACFVDGGHDYSRIGGKLEYVEDLREFSKPHVIVVVEVGCIYLYEVENLEHETLANVIGCKDVAKVYVTVDDVKYIYWIDGLSEPSVITLTFPDGVRLYNTLAITREDEEDMTDEDLQKFRGYINAKV